MDDWQTSDRRRHRGACRELPLVELMAAAGALRDGQRRRGFVFAQSVHPADGALPRRLPLLHLCPAPAPLRAAYLTPDQVLAIAREGARPVAARRSSRSATSRSSATARRAKLAALGTRHTCLPRAMAERVLRETGLLPHLNPGVMTAARLPCARTGVQGIMLESASDRLATRRPAFRLAGQEAGVRLKAIGMRARQRAVYLRSPHRHRRDPAERIGASSRCAGCTSATATSRN